jgi:hypothetical protein
MSSISRFSEKIADKAESLAYRSVRRIAHRIEIGKKEIRDTVEFTGKQGIISRTVSFMDKLRQLKKIHAESQNQAEFIGKLIPLLEVTEKELPIKIKLRRKKDSTIPKGSTAEAKLKFKNLRVFRNISIEKDNEKLAHLDFVDVITPFRNNGRKTQILYIDTTDGTKDYAGLHTTLIQALLEHKINSGKLPYLEGGAVTDGNFVRVQNGTKSRCIPSKNMHVIMGAEVINTNTRGIPLVGISSKEHARAIVEKMLKKGEFIFPETEANARKLLEK